MPELRCESDLGPGGLILDRELVLKLRRLPPLLPGDLLKLSGFYRKYQTNRQLADHLALVALMRLAGDPDKELQASIENVLSYAAKNTNQAPTSTAFTIQLEDGLDGFSDEGPNDRLDLFLIKQYPIGDSGFNLLVETGEQQKRFYVIGVSPDLDKLPHLRSNRDA